MTPEAKPVPRAGWYLAVLVFINLFNYLDRQILAAVLPFIQRDGTIFSPHDPLAETKAGWLGSAFLLSYMLFSPLFGWLDGKRYRRWMLLGLGVSLWSLASGGCGSVNGFAMLFALRCLVGIGEGAYGPIASAMIADLYPAKKRGLPMALFNMAIPVGSALGYLVGAQIAGLFEHWRPAFWITFSGLALGLVCFFQKEPPRTVAENRPVPNYFEVLKSLLGNRSFVLGCQGMTAITFVLGGVVLWSPTYLFQRESQFEFSEKAFEKMNVEDAIESVPAETLAKLAPLKDGERMRFPEVRKELAERLNNEEGILYAQRIYRAAATDDSPKSKDLTTLFGAMIILGGLAATWFGSVIGERLRLRMSGAYFLVSAAGAFFSIPFFLGLLYLPMIWGWPCVFLCVFGLFLHTGPAFTLLANVTKSDERATGFAINILVIHALGDVISPPLMGWIAGQSSLQMSFVMLTGMIALGGIIWLFGIPGLQRDTERAEAAE